MNAKDYIKAENKEYFGSEYIEPEIKSLMSKILTIK